MSGLGAVAPAPPAEAPVELPAAGSSFYAGMRVLPRARREGMYAVYAFCRAVDDVADGDAPGPLRLAELDRWRTDLEALCAGGAVPPRVAFLAGPTREFGLLREDYLAVVDGMAMDAQGDICAPDEATLDLYCDRVASAVGRLSVRVFGLSGPAGVALAHHLGRALQLTNILRDLDEDAGRGRLYLPREGLAAIGLADPTPAAALAHPRLGEVCEGLAARAAGHYAAATEIMDAAPRRAVKAPRLMAAAYAPVLARMRARGWAAPRRRVGVDKPRLLLAVLRYGLLP